MISVVCVYNNEKTLKEVLLRSLKGQTVEFELITLDNRDGRFKSAAEALNYGGAKAKGDYIAFAHHDMWLGSNTWLEEAERVLASIPDLGIAGVAGHTKEGKNWHDRCRFSIDIFGETWEGAEPVQKLEEVQTLDECLLIVPRPVFDKLKFDDKVFDGWHCYGADYCLSVRQLGLRAYVIPGSCSHSCIRGNMQELLKYLDRLRIKHGKNHGRIHTWTGDASWLYVRWASLVAFVRPFYLKMFPDARTVRKRELAGCDSLVDLGCGHHSMLLYSDVLPSIDLSIGVEVFDPALQDSKRKRIHSQYIRVDAASLELKPKSIDAVVAIELLEHLTKEEGAALLIKMQNWARKRVMVTTPNGYVWQGALEGNPFQVHKSGWSVKELREFGYEVHGLGGWKGLRGHRGLIKYRPNLLWLLISNLTQYITRYLPELAFQLHAIKRTDEADRK